MQTEPPKTKTRRFQFGLRTLFVVVTVWAVLFGAVAWVINDRQRLIRERDEARQAAEFNCQAAVDADSRAKATEKNAISEREAAAAALELQKLQLSERPERKTLVPQRFP
jgi:hypothetical protein